MHAPYAISLVSENLCSSNLVYCSVVVTRWGMRMPCSSCNSVSKRLHLVCSSKGIDSSQSSLNRQRSCMMDLASNVTGPISPSGSKIRDMRDKMLRLVGVSRRGRWLIEWLTNTWIRQLGNPMQCLTPSSRSSCLRIRWILLARWNFDPGGQEHWMPIFWARISRPAAMHLLLDRQSFIYWVGLRDEIIHVEISQCYLQRPRIAIRTVLR